MKVKKTRLRNSFMIIAIETEDKLTDSDLEAIVDLEEEWLFNFFISYPSMFDFGNKCLCI